MDELKALWRGVKLSTSQSSIPLNTVAPLFLPQLISLLYGNSVDSKATQHIVAVLNVSNFSQGVSRIKLTTLVLTETCGPHAITTVTAYMQKWCAKRQHKVNRRN